MGALYEPLNSVRCYKMDAISIRNTTQPQNCVTRTLVAISYDYPKATATNIVNALYQDV